MGSMDAGDIARLERVQARVRELARSVIWLPAAIRRAMPGMRALCDLHTAEKNALEEQHEQSARVLLASGRLRDPAVLAGAPLHVVSITGLCPADLAADLSKHPKNSLPPDLEARSAGAALAAFERQRESQSREVSRERKRAIYEEDESALNSRAFASVTWNIYVRLIEPTKRIPNPRTRKPWKLALFDSAQYRTIVLYRLGGLADTGSTRPIVQRPEKVADIVERLQLYINWRRRFPSAWDSAANSPGEELDACSLPAAVAEQFLADLEQMVQQRSTSWEAPAVGGTETPAQKEKQLIEIAAAAGRLIDAFPEWMQECGHLWAQERRSYWEKYLAYAAQRDVRNPYCQAKWDSGHTGSIPDAPPLPPEPFDFSDVEPPSIAWQGLPRETQLAFAATRLVALYAHNGHLEVTDFLPEPSAMVLLIQTQDMEVGEAALYLRLVCEALSGISHPGDPTRISVSSPQGLAAASSPAPAPTGKPRRGIGTARRLSDKVRELLSRDIPYQGTRAELAKEAGYGNQSALDRIKNFKELWAKNEARLQAQRRGSANHMANKSNQ